MHIYFFTLSNYLNILECKSICSITCICSCISNYLNILECKWTKSCYQIRHGERGNYLNILECKY